VLFCIGAICACGLLASPLGWPTVALAAGLALGLRLAAAARLTGSARVIRWVACVALLSLYAVWAYLGIVFGWLLGWTVPWPVDFVLLFLAVAALATTHRRIADLRVPLVLPLGLWIAVCLLGWWRQDGVIQCDDYANFLSDSSVTLAIPSTRALTSCAPSESLRLRRYPRRVWEAPDASRYVITTQEGINFLAHGTPVPDPIEHAVCEFAKDGSRGACVGAEGYKMQFIFDSERLDRLFVGGWGWKRGIVYSLDRQGPLRVLGEVETQGSTGEGYYDPDADVIGLLADECTGLTRIRASNLSPLPPTPAPFCPGEAHYDPVRHEGILCFAPGQLGRLIPGGEEGYLSVAFRGNPFSFRLLGTSSPHLWAHGALVWGCDFDPERRVAWVLVANFGLVAVIDYDSGRIVDTWWLEPGLRSAAFDRDRGLLYVTNFLRGDVIAIDVATGGEVRRWFAGRFVRYVVPARDGNSLLVTSNLGVVRIALPPPPGARA
jgi:hypothetical protein